MSETTNLKLFKHDEPLETNENDFDIDKALNQNWDKIDDFAEQVNDKVIEMEDNIEAQGQDITELQQNKETVNTQLETLQEEIKELEQDVKANAVIEETEKEKSLYISDASGARGRLDVLGNVEQEVTETSPSINYPSPLKILGDNINVFDGEVEIGFIDSNTGQNSAQDNVWRSKNYININNKDISLSIEKLKYTGSVGRVLYYKGDNAYLSSAQINSIPFSLKLPEEASKIRFYILDSVAPLESKVKIEESPTATSYSPHGQGSTEIIDSNKNIFNKNKVIKVGRYNSSGQFVGTSTWRYYEFIPIPNADYTIQVKNNFSNEVYFVGFSKDGTETLITSFNAKTVTFNAQNFTKIGYSVKENELDNCQLEKGNTATELVEHQEQSYILDIQKPMLKWDYFDLERKKEVHVTNKIILDGTKKFVVGNPAGRYCLDTELNNLSYEAISNCFKQGTENTFNVDNTIVLQTNRINLMNKEIATAEEFDNAVLELYNAGTPIEIYYPTTEPTELDLTESQIQVLEQLNKLRLYKGVNNILTTEDIALLQAEYGVDIQTKINNVISTQLSQIGGN